MNFINYNLSCLITSIIMLIILILQFRNINFCIILLLGALFSIIWRSIKLIEGENNIEKNNNINHSITNPFFLLDFTFGFLAYLCITTCNQINKKFILLTFLIFILAWILHLSQIKELSRTVHLCGHIYILIIFILTYYFNLA